MTSCALRGGSGERGAQDHQRAPGQDGAGLPAPVDPGPGPRAHRVDDAAVRAGGYRGRAGLGTGGRGGHRPGPGPVGDVGGAPGRVPGADVAGLPGRGRVGDVRACCRGAGSACGGGAAFAGRKFPQRAYGGAWAGRRRWGPLTHHRVLQVLKTPAYAGAYVHGRHVTRKRLDADGNVRTSTAEVPRAEWKVLIKDHHPRYVTWDEYRAVEASLQANWPASRARPVPEGRPPPHGIL